MRYLVFALLIITILFPRLSFSSTSSFDVSSPSTGGVVEYTYVGSGGEVEYQWTILGADAINGEECENSIAQFFNEHEGIIEITWGNISAPRILGIGIYNPSTESIDEFLEISQNSSVAPCQSSLRFFKFQTFDEVPYSDLCDGIKYDVVVNSNAKCKDCTTPSMTIEFEGVIEINNVAKNPITVHPECPDESGYGGTSSMQYGYKVSGVIFGSVNDAMVKVNSSGCRKFGIPGLTCTIYIEPDIHPVLYNHGSFIIDRPGDFGNFNLTGCNGPDVLFKVTNAPPSYDYSWDYSHNPLGVWNQNGTANPDETLINNNGGKGPADLRVIVSKGDGNQCPSQSFPIIQPITVNPDIDPEIGVFHGIQFKDSYVGTPHCENWTHEKVGLKYSRTHGLCLNDCDPGFDLDPEGFVKGIWSIRGSQGNVANITSPDDPIPGWGPTTDWINTANNEATIQYAGADWIEIDLTLKFSCGDVAANTFRINTGGVPEAPSIKLIHENGDLEGFCDDEKFTLSIEDLPYIQEWELVQGLKYSFPSSGNSTEERFEVDGASQTTGKVRARYSWACGTSAWGNFQHAINPAIGANSTMGLVVPSVICKGELAEFDITHTSSGAIYYWEVRSNSSNWELPNVITPWEGNELDAWFPDTNTEFDIHAVGVNCLSGNIRLTESYDYNGLYYCNNEDPETRIGFIDKGSRGDIHVYPNPSKGNVTFELYSGLIKQLKIYSLEGGVVFSSDYINESEKQVFLSLPKGLYIAKVVSEDKVHSTYLQIE